MSTLVPDGVDIMNVSRCKGQNPEDLELFNPDFDYGKVRSNEVQLQAPGPPLTLGEVRSL